MSGKEKERLEWPTTICIDESCKRITHREVLLLPLRIFALRDYDGVAGEVPCEYDLGRCGLVFLSQGYN